MPIGELEAAFEGRDADRGRQAQAGASTQRRTRGRAQVDAEVAASGPQMQGDAEGAGLIAFPRSWVRFEGVEKELERAAANIPDPTYPKR